jgi:hypothetical protein
MVRMLRSDLAHTLSGSEPEVPVRSCGLSGSDRTLPPAWFFFSP